MGSIFSDHSTIPGWVLGKCDTRDTMPGLRGTRDNNGTVGFRKRTTGKGNVIPGLRGESPVLFDPSTTPTYPPYAHFRPFTLLATIVALNTLVEKNVLTSTKKTQR